MRNLSRSKRQDRLCAERNKIMDNTPIPKKVINAMSKSMQQDHFIYYKRKGRYVELACTVTGKKEEFLLREKAVSMEEEMAAIGVETPVHKGRTYKCPCCGNEGIYIADGLKKYTGRYKYAIAYKAINEKMLCGRVIAMHVDYHDVDGFYNTWEQRMSYAEYIRTYYDCNEQRMYIDYKKRSYGRDTYYWDYKKEYSGTESPRCGMTEYNVHEIYKTFLKYFNLTRFIGDRYYYLGFLVENPEIELLQKMGADKICHALITGREIKKDYKKKKPWERYHISKEMWNIAVRENRGIEFIIAAQKVREYGLPENRKNVMFMEKIREKSYRWPPKCILEYASAKKIANYLNKKHYESEYMTYVHYFDYLDAAVACGYDLSNDVYMFPKDLRAKHDEMVARRNLLKNKKEIDAKNEKYKKIEEKYKKLNKKYLYEDGEFLIRPARSAREIIEEGQKMHHCVGGDNYLNKHNKGITFILLMRRRKNPEEPFCTVEIKEDEIQQWYEAHDKKPDKEIIQPWLDNYIKHLKEEKHGTDGVKLAAG